MRKEENERKTEEKTAPATEYSHDSETSLETPAVSEITAQARRKPKDL
jgi:hypothetical protein